jgi:hypothetical protein
MDVAAVHGSAARPPDAAAAAAGPDTHTYSAYGLAIESQLALPELVAAPSGGDVHVAIGPVQAPPDPGDGRPLWWTVSPREATIVYRGVASVTVRDGSRIVVDPVPGADERVLRRFVLGPGLATVLRQRGVPTLHASAVDLGRLAVAFLGHAGSGKSTIAAALHARGHPLVADDVVVLSETKDGYAALPAVPRVKLWPESAATLGIPSDTMTRLAPDLEKRAWQTEAFASEPVPLGAIYVLAEGPDVAIGEMPPADAVVELVRHTPGAESLHAFAGPEGLRQSADVVRSVRIRQLRRPWRLDALAAVADAVELDARTTPEAAS